MDPATIDTILGCVAVYFRMNLGIIDTHDLIIDAELNKRLFFWTETRVEDIVRGKDILQKMYLAGFRRIACGVESPYDHTQKFLQKRLNWTAVNDAAELMIRSQRSFTRSMLVMKFGSQNFTSFLGRDECSAIRTNSSMTF